MASDDVLYGGGIQHARSHKEMSSYEKLQIGTPRTPLGMSGIKLISGDKKTEASKEPHLGLSRYHLLRQGTLPVKGPSCPSAS